MKKNSKYGVIEINKNTIAQIAHQSAMESYGLVGFGYKTKTNGIVEILKGENISKGVSVTELEDGTLEIELYVIVQYGTNIQTVAQNIVSKVKYNIEKFTDIKVSKINVNVQSVRVK